MGQRGAAGGGRHRARGRGAAGRGRTHIAGVWREPAAPGAGARPAAPAARLHRETAASSRSPCAVATCWWPATRSPGKSWVAGLLCEQLILHGYCVCVIDPEGDYRSLEALPGVTRARRRGSAADAARAAPRPSLPRSQRGDRSVASAARRQDQYIRALLPALNVLRRRTGLPHRIVLDEAHYFLHDGDDGGSCSIWSSTATRWSRTARRGCRRRCWRRRR